MCYSFMAEQGLKCKKIYLKNVIRTKTRMFM